MTIFEKTRSVGVIPVLGLRNPDTAEQLAAALIAGGIPAIEVTLRNPAAVECLSRIKKAYPDMICGAGTILTTAMADEAMAAGAEFLVSPGFDPKLVAYCQEKGYPIMPGVSSPSEVQCAVAMGLTDLKFFPAEAGGGPAVLKLISSAFPKVRFVATGGITMDNLADYLALPCVSGVGGSFMAPAAMIAEGKFAEITALCTAAMHRMLNFRIVHVGVNCDEDAEAKATAELLAKIFSIPVIPHSGCYFAGTLFEVLKQPGRGAKGHIAIGTNDIHRAIAFVESKGIKLDHENAKYMADGRLLCVFFAEEIAGFALHLLQC